jgi:hypothetical protein
MKRRSQHSAIGTAIPAIGPLIGGDDGLPHGEQVGVLTVKVGRPGFVTIDCEIKEVTVGLAAVPGLA